MAPVLELPMTIFWNLINQIETTEWFRKHKKMFEKLMV